MSEVGLDEIEVGSGGVVVKWRVYVLFIVGNYILVLVVVSCKVVLFGFLVF